jgi:transposase
VKKCSLDLVKPGWICEIVGMDTDTLFPLPTGDEKQDDANTLPRLLRANREQIELRPVDLEGVLPADHRARVVWDFVQGLDLRQFHATIRAVDGHAGRPAIDPAILLALWLYATLEGVGSARAVARLCEAHDAYRWLCGGVGMNYHTLADFRVGHAAEVDALLTQSVASLRSAGLVQLTRVAQDGLRVRASAGQGSFRRGPRLAQFLAEAATQVAVLRAEVDADPQATTRRQAAARERAARERHERVQRALAELPKIAALKRKKGKPPDEARASTTDAEARTMHLPDGGFAPAFNVQLASTPGSQVIVGVDVTNVGSDAGQLRPMVAQVAQRYGDYPAQWLVDGGYTAQTGLQEVSRQGCQVYAPVPPARRTTRSPYDARPSDSAEIIAWRQRMQTPEAQALYKERAATAECVNALARNRGLRAVAVRGLAKVRAVALWFALAHNLLRTHSLRVAAAPS